MQDFLSFIAGYQLLTSKAILALTIVVVFIIVKKLTIALVNRVRFCVWYLNTKAQDKARIRYEKARNFTNTQVLVIGSKTAKYHKYKYHLLSTVVLTIVLLFI